MSHFRHCWVCFATEQDDPGAEWLSPCRCRGSTKWVHLTCLQYWLDTRLRVSQQPIRCQLCEVAYSVIFPQMGECQLIQGHIIGPQRCGGALYYPFRQKEKLNTWCLTGVGRVVCPVSGECVVG